MDGRGREYGTIGMKALRLILRAVSSAAPIALRRLLRQAVRHAVGVYDGRIALPRRFGLSLTFALFGTTAAYASIISGEMDRWVDQGAAWAGYPIETIRLVGANETSEAAIASSIGVDTTLSLVGIDPLAARDALLALPWIEKATVAKEYPNALDVTVEERRAVALWRLDGRTLLLDKDGAPIVESDGRALPLLVGEDADKAMNDGLALFRSVPAMTPEIKALVRVASRRWDIVTHRNMVVMLPADRPEAALETLAALHAEKSVLDKDVAAIDLRVPDRVAFRLTEDGADHRTEVMAARAEERKKNRKFREVEL